mmetsp:Transcript_14306/g.19942  ORF Transcript_14306/g.19942 Transcript_14306/m.19942 type:complete len:87 (+) Transcript_14306:97-357(+)
MLFLKEFLNHHFQQFHDLQQMINFTNDEIKQFVKEYNRNEHEDDKAELVQKYFCENNQSYCIADVFNQYFLQTIRCRVPNTQQPST